MTVTCLQAKQQTGIDIFLSFSQFSDHLLPFLILCFVSCYRELSWGFKNFKQSGKYAQSVKDNRLINQKMDYDFIFVQCQI